MEPETTATKIGELRNAETGETLVELHGPARSDDALSLALCVLTHALQQHTGQQTGGGLGGPYGYGVEFENDVFMMHPYCWCERTDCRWCRACACEGHWPDGEYRNGAEWIVTKQCESCLNPQAPAPNFHYKPLDLKVRWYKYIGRDMDLEGDSDCTTGDILRGCLQSFGGPAMEEAVQAWRDAEDAYHRRFVEFMQSALNTPKRGEA